MLASGGRCCNDRRSPPPDSGHRDRHTQRQACARLSRRTSPASTRYGRGPSATPRCGQKLSGSRSQMQQNVILDIGQAQELNFTLQVGLASESVTVTPGTPILRNGRRKRGSGNLAGSVSGKWSVGSRINPAHCASSRCARDPIRRTHFPRGRCIPMCIAARVRAPPNARSRGGSTAAHSGSRSPTSSAIRELPFSAAPARKVFMKDPPPC